LEREKGRKNREKKTEDVCRKDAGGSQGVAKFLLEVTKGITSSLREIPLGPQSIGGTKVRILRELQLSEGEAECGGRYCSGHDEIRRRRTRNGQFSVTKDRSIEKLSTVGAGWILRPLLWGVEDRKKREICPKSHQAGSEEREATRKLQRFEIEERNPLRLALKRKRTLEKKKEGREKQLCT